MDILYFLESIRSPLLEKIMMFITELGSETAFLAIALIVFWCYDKRKGYFIMSVGFAGTILSQAMKITCRIPRPWVLDPNFTTVEGAQADAGGYSFPSGHSQSSVGTFGSLARTTESKWIRFICIAIAVLVPFSRMYVGVHTPADVLVGSAISLVLIFALRPFVYSNHPKAMPRLFAVMVGIAVVYLAYVELFPFPADTDSANLNSAVKNAYTLLGALLGVVVAYYADEKRLHFEVKTIWWAQMIKVVMGLLVVLAIKSGLKEPLDTLFAGHHIARGIRYFLVVLAAGVAWPAIFSMFSKFGKR
jgi:undecaprenyl-diphosphatase